MEGSPCLNSGLDSSVVGATDIDGEGRIIGGSVDVGCDERWDEYLTDTLEVGIKTPIGANTILGHSLEFQSEISGKPCSTVWDFGDETSASNQCVLEHTFSSPGEYNVTLLVTNRIHSAIATVKVLVVSAESPEWYVGKDGDDAATGRSWSEAKATLQAGIDATGVGGMFC